MTVGLVIWIWEIQERDIGIWLGFLGWWSEKMMITMMMIWEEWRWWSVDAEKMMITRSWRLKRSGNVFIFICVLFDWWRLKQMNLCLRLYKIDLCLSLKMYLCLNLMKNWFAEENNLGTFFVNFFTCLSCSWWPDVFVWDWRDEFVFDLMKIHLQRRNKILECFSFLLIFNISYIFLIFFLLIFNFKLQNILTCINWVWRVQYIKCKMTKLPFLTRSTVRLDVRWLMIGEVSVN